MATVEVHDGRPVAVRTGGDDLRREAAVLRRLAGPGIPQVVRCDDDGTTVRLVTAVAPPVPAAALAAVAAEVASVLARAHEAGITHGPLREEHLLGAPGALLVTGWDPSGHGDPHADVAALAGLLERHAGSDPVVRTAITRALAPDPPAMAAFAEMLAGAPGPAVPGHRPLPLAVLAGLAVALTLVAVGLLVDSPRSAARPAAATVTQPPPSTTTTTSTTTSDARVLGNVVERGGERWTVGRPGDDVFLGDWDCDGEPTPAVLRRTTGQVWTFAGWPAAGAPDAGRLLRTVVGATGARVRRVGGCDRLEITTTDGRPITVR